MAQNINTDYNNIYMLQKMGGKGRKMDQKITSLLNEMSSNSGCFQKLDVRPGCRNAFR